MDHLAASIELAVFHDCAMCLCPTKEFSCFCSAPRPQLSVQQLGELYFGSLLDLAMHIRNANTRPTVEDLERFLRASVASHSVHRFPSLFTGNSTAHVGLLRAAARKLELSDLLSSLSVADADRVQKLFVEAIELDAQITRCAVITKHSTTGFDLACVNLCVPQLHCLGQLCGRFCA